MPKEPRATRDSQSKAYTCSCIKFCKGIMRQISKSTYLRHSKYAATTLKSVTSSAAPVKSSGFQSPESDTVSSLVDYQLHTDQMVFLSTYFKDLQFKNNSARNGPLTQARQLEEDTEFAYNSEEDLVEGLNIDDPGCLNEIKTEAQHGDNTGSSSDSSDDIGPCLDKLFNNTHLTELHIANKFIQELKNATLDGEHCGLDPEALAHLRNPPTTLFMLNNQPDLHLAFDLFLASLKASVDVYNASHASILRCHPEDSLPSYNQMKTILACITGVNFIVHAMCKNSCIAFRGPLAGLDHCSPRCKELKHCPISKKYNQEFHTMPIGPILQALWRHPESAHRFQYHRTKTHEIIEELQLNSGELSTYEDFFHGSDYLKQVRNGNITDNDIILMFSIDSTQLYAHKALDCWIYIWVIMDFSPHECYKKEYIIPGGFIPGPKKPKNLDSFLFPGLYHLVAIQKEGLSIWNAATNLSFRSQLFLGLDTADGPAMAYLSGLVGHHGKYRCCLYRPTPSRHKTNGPHYYPTLLKPMDYTMPGCNHPDLSHFLATVLPNYNHYLSNLGYLLGSPTDMQYKKRCLETGIVKPTIFLSLPSHLTLQIPRCFGSDIMHLGTFNLSDLLLSLWHGVLDHN